MKQLQFVRYIYKKQVEVRILAKAIRNKSATDSRVYVVQVSRKKVNITWHKPFWNIITFIHITTTTTILI
jgi:hypothetical protein